MPRTTPRPPGGIEASLKIAPTNADVSTDLAVSYYYTNQVDQALAQFARSLEIDPKHTKTWLNLGIVRAFGKQDLAGAGEAWTQVVNLAPADSPEARAARQALDGLKSAHPEIAPGGAPATRRRGRAPALRSREPERSARLAPPAPAPVHAGAGADADRRRAHPRPDRGRAGARRATTGEPAPGGVARSHGTLVQDPVCGTYVLQERALAMKTAGGTAFFCSERCRSAYDAQAARSR